MRTREALKVVRIKWIVREIGVPWERCLRVSSSTGWAEGADTAEGGRWVLLCRSIQDGSVAILTPHTAFVDPTTPPDAPLRESIELRTLVFYD